MAICTIPFASAMPTSARPPTSAPATIHGARRPKRERVRSEIMPATGCAIIAAKAPMVVMSARLATLFASSIAGDLEREEDAGDGAPQDEDREVGRDDPAEQALEAARDEGAGFVDAVGFEGGGGG